MSIRKLILAATLAVAPIAVAVPANALAVNHTVCYNDEGSYVVDPPSEDGFAYCVTRTGSSGGSTGLQLCTITVNGVNCTPYAPLQG